MLPKFFCFFKSFSLKMAYGKCYFKNLETGLECGCLRYRATKIIQFGENDLCKCKHYECFHEEVKPSPNSFYYSFLTQNQIIQSDFEYEIPLNVDEMINNQMPLTNYGELNGDR